MKLQDRWEPCTHPPIIRQTTTGCLRDTIDIHTPAITDTTITHTTITHITPILTIIPTIHTVTTITTDTHGITHGATELDRGHIFF